MKEIPLTKGRVALVDDDMYDYLMQWKWQYGSKGYAVRGEYYMSQDGRKVRKTILMHRVIMETPDDLVVDHLDNDSVNNQKHNLRNCTQSENLRNVKAYRSNKTGLKGVSFTKKYKRYISHIDIDKKRIHLGSFSCPILAAHAYNLAAIKHHGQFASLNKIDANELLLSQEINQVKAPKFIGITKTKSSKWVAQLWVKRKRFYSSVFLNEVDAAKAYNDLALKHYGEFAVLNQIPA